MASQGAAPASIEDAAEEAALLLPQHDEPPRPARPSSNQHKGPPLWTWLLLTASLFAVSSAGVVYSLMSDVPPLTLASWRLQLTAVLLLPGSIVQHRAMDPAARQDVRSAAVQLAASGSALAVHFGCWVASLQLTSLTHSLLFVSVAPVILALLSCVRGHSLTAGEILGTAVGVVGTVVLASGATKEAEATLRGDAAALAAAVAFVPYLLIGRALRPWMPLFVYAAPVTALASLLLAVAALVQGGAGLFAAGAGGVVGWTASARYMPLVLYLAVVPGIVGHTGINALLRYMNPLVITLVLNMEPLVGSCLGFLFKLNPSPGTFTYLGGGLLLASTALVSIASNERERREKEREEDSNGGTRSHIEQQHLVEMEVVSS